MNNRLITELGIALYYLECAQSKLTSLDILPKVAVNMEYCRADISFYLWVLKQEPANSYIKYQEGY